MDIYTIDFETYYDSDYTLTKLKTEEYVRDPRFEVHCVGISRNGGEPICVPKPQIEAVFAKIPWHAVGVLCQNTLFDGFILAERYGIRAQFYFDTKAIFNREYPHEKATLYNIAKVLRLYTQKGEMSSKGMHYADFTPQQLAAHMNYCKDDCRATWQAWQKLKGSMNLMELQLIDLTIKWFCFPQLILDPVPLLEEMAAEHARKNELLTKIAEMEEVTAGAKTTKALAALSVNDRAKKSLMSNPQLAAILEQLGVDVPIKAAPAQLKKQPELKQYVEDFNHWLLTNDFAVNERNLHITGIDEDGDPEYGEAPAYPWTYAFAKNDTNFKHLMNHPDERVAMIVEARLGCKSTINESRAKTLHGISQRGPMPVPLIYWGAAPGRWSGTQGINLQNLTRGSRLRKAICAPPGYRIVVCDLSAIEARVNAWFSGQQDAVNIFAQNGDIYCVMAESLYGRRVTKADKQERRLGKTVILGCGYGMSWKRFFDYVINAPDGAIIFGDAEVQQFGLSVAGFLANKKNAVFVKVNRPRHWTEAAFAAHCCVCEYIIKVYRTTNFAIKAQWDDCKRALPDMLGGYEREVGAVDGVVWTAKDKLITPNNRILYPGLASKDGKEYTRRTRDGIGHLNGSLLTENIVQHLSRQIMAEQTIEAVRCGLNVVFTCHDEIVCLEREAEAEVALKQLEKIMSTAPVWAPGLPVNCEGSHEYNYGDAK